MQSVFREFKEHIDFYATTRLTFPSHTHEDIEVVYVKSGGGTAFCDGKKYELTPGSFFLVFPNQVHQYTEASGGEYILLIIKSARLLHNHERYLQEYPVSSLYQVTDGDDHNTARLLEMALEEYEQNGYSTIIEAYLTAFFEKLLTFYTIERRNTESDTALRILQYCAEHYKDDINIENVASALYISKSSVSHIFSARLSTHFCDHINSLRLLDAVRLLHNQNYPITEVSAAAGFPSLRTFNRVFRKQYGVTPSDYRKSLLNADE